MIKETLNYVGYDGEEVVEEARFNMELVEVLEWEASMPGGLENYLKEIRETEDKKKTFDFIKELIARSYGVLVGNKFEKKPEHLEEFMQTPAYSQFFMKLAVDADAANAFLKGVIPQIPEEMEKKAKATAKKAAATVPASK